LISPTDQKRLVCRTLYVDTKKKAENYEWEGRVGSAVIGKLCPGHYGTSITSYVTLLAPASRAGPHAGTPFYEPKFL